MIKEIYIKNFGKLNDFSLKFNKGLNVIYGKNESGKTTILNFIYMVLYGTNTKSNDIIQNNRKKYKPWNNSQMQGYIIIHKDNIDYKIERTFNMSNSTDIVDIFEADTGKKINISNVKEPGKYFFNMDQESFKKTLYISSESTIITSDGKKDELTKKLINLVSTGEEDISYKSAQQNLDKKIEEYESKSGHKGKIIEIKSEIENIKSELEEAKIDEKEKISLLEVIENLNENKSMLNNKIDYLNNLILLKNEKNKILNDIKNIELDKKEDIIISNLYTNLDNKKNELEKNKNKNLIDIISIISLIFSIILTLYNKLFFILFLLSIFYFIFSYIQNKNKKQSNIQKIKSDINSLKNEINEKNKSLKYKNDEIYFMSKAIDELDNQIDSCGYSYHEISYDTLDKLKEEKNNIEKNITQLYIKSKEKYRAKRNISTIYEDLEHKSTILKKLEKEYNLLLITKSFIKKSFDELSIDFSKKINDISSKYIIKITNNKYSNLYISNDFNISIQDNDTKKLKEWKYLSSGTIDQIYLALRLSIINLIVNNYDEKIILLDDIFIRYDENRILDTFDLLTNSNFSQILFFTSKSFKNIDYKKFNYIDI